MYNLRAHGSLLVLIGAAGLAVIRAPEVVAAFPLVCGLRFLTGLNCPFCGMTRDFLLLGAGQAATHNPFSPAVAALLFLVYPATVAICLLKGRDFPLTPEHAFRWLPIALAGMFVGNNLEVIRWMNQAVFN